MLTAQRGDHAIDDTTAPRVELLLTKQGELELQFSEEISPVVASGAILLDGAATPWELENDGYTMKPTSALSATTHTLAIGPSLHDLAGNALAEPFSRTITTGGPDQIVYERQDQRIIATSTVDNLASFQGHIQDPATGLVYMRNRWMDSEMGRVLSNDSYLYVDGPNPAQVLGENPLSNEDPSGLLILGYASALSRGKTWSMAEGSTCCGEFDLFDFGGNPTDLSFVERAGTRLVTFVHGYNVDPWRAVHEWLWQVDEGFYGIGAEQNMFGFVWKGDLWGYGPADFPNAERNADLTGLAFEKYLRRIRARGGSGIDHFVITHSLGARVALSGLQRIAAHAGGLEGAQHGEVPTIDGLFLFNAAVPLASLAPGGEFSTALGAVGHAFNFFSAKDPVLRRYFESIHSTALGRNRAHELIPFELQERLEDLNMASRAVAGSEACEHSNHLLRNLWPETNCGGERGAHYELLWKTLVSRMNAAARASQ